MPPGRFSRSVLQRIVARRGRLVDMPHTSVDDPVADGTGTAAPTDDAAAAAATGRQQAAAGVVVVIAVALALVGILGAGNLHTYQVVLDIAGAVLMLGAAALLARGRAPWLAIITGWLAALGVIAEFGDFQARENDTGALSATNTSYFLPGLSWLLMFGLLGLAIVVTVFARRPK